MLGIDLLSWAMLGTVSCWRAAWTRDKTSRSAAVHTHVLGHNFAPFAFQKPRLGLLTEQTVLYTFSWFWERSRPFGREREKKKTSRIRMVFGVRVFIRRSAAAYGDEVSAPPEPISYGF
jgi:hypothetical protein